jgi:hypothetical protein
MIVVSIFMACRTSLGVMYSVFILHFMLLWSFKQRSVVVSASTVVLLSIPYIEFKTKCVNTNLDEIFQNLK